MVVATPGRLVDLLLNASDFGLEDVEMLVLDEADRLLDMGFIDQITEIVVNHCTNDKNTKKFLYRFFFFVVFQVLGSGRRCCSPRR